MQVTIGDSVRIKEGELAGAYGVVVSIDNVGQTALIERNGYEFIAPLSALEAN